MNTLQLVRKTEEKKRKLHQAQLVITKKSACPLR